MSFGLRTWDGQGRLETDTSTFTYQILLSVLIDFSTGSDHSARTFSVPAFSPTNCVAVLLPVNLADPDFDYQVNNMPWIEVAPGVISVRPVHPNGAQSGSPTLQRSRLRVRLLAMRYKK